MNQPGSTRLFRNKHFLAYLLLVASVCGVYANAVWGVFQFDDYTMIVRNPSVHSIDGWLTKTLHGGIRPFLTLTYTLNWVVSSGEVGFHLFNISIHLLTTLLAYELSRRFISSCDRLSNTGFNLESAALIAALLFALHPLQTEAVTYITGRSSSLMALFFLAALLAYLHGVEHRSRLWLYIVSPLLFVLAVASKEVAIFFPVALVVWECSTGNTGWKKQLQRQSVHWSIMLLLLAAILLQPRYGRLFLFSFELRSLHDNLISQLNGIFYVFYRLVLPGSLNIDPDITAATRMNLKMLFILTGCIFAMLAALYQRYRRPWFLFALLWFAVTVFPNSAIIPRTDIINERHMYLADFGIFLCAGITFVQLAGFAGGHVFLRRVFVTTLFGILGFFTIQRNAEYRTEILLWESAARLSPNKSRVFNNLGCAYEFAGLPVLAAEAYKKAVLLQHDNKTANENLNRILLRRNATVQLPDIRYKQ